MPDYVELTSPRATDLGATDVRLWQLQAAKQEQDGGDVALAAAHAIRTARLAAEQQYEPDAQAFERVVMSLTAAREVAVVEKEPGNLK
jgi:hypothetical protein